MWDTTTHEPVWRAAVGRGARVVAVNPSPASSLVVVMGDPRPVVCVLSDSNGAVLSKREEPDSAHAHEANAPTSSQWMGAATVPSGKDSTYTLVLRSDGAFVEAIDLASPKPRLKLCPETGTRDGGAKVVVGTGSYLAVAYVRGAAVFKLNV